jgi:hypothetical protein
MATIYTPRIPSRWTLTGIRIENEGMGYPRGRSGGCVCAGISTGDDIDICIIGFEEVRSIRGLKNTF